MPYQFIVGGPVKIPFEKINNGRFISPMCKQDFLGSEDFEPFASKHGVYIFCLRAGQGYTPWYVGKTSGQNGMRQECMTDNKINKYNYAIQKYMGTPVLFFVTRPGNISVAPREVVKDMEKQLIQDAWAKNNNILNVQNANIPKWSIKGVIRSSVGAPTNLERIFRRFMGI